MSKFNENFCLVQDYICTLGKNQRMESFYPQTLSRKLNIPLDLVLIELAKLEESGLVQLKYEVKHNEACVESTLCIVDDCQDLINTEYLCDLCGENITITYNDIYPLYFITDEYKKYLKN